MKCEMLQIADEASSRADELYKRYQLLHGALDFRLFFHPSHNIPVIREVPPPPSLTYICFSVIRITYGQGG